MPKRSNEFQYLVLLIERALQPKEYKVTESKELIDTSTGEAREVDIVIELCAGIHSITIGVECTARGRKAGVPWVETMIGKHANLPTNRLILVSKSGFYKTAKAKAAKLGITTLDLSQAEDADWVSIIRPMQSVILSFFKSLFISHVHVSFCEYLDPEIDTAALDLPNSRLFRPDGSDSIMLAEYVGKTLLDNQEFVTELAKRVPDKIEVEVNAEIPMRDGIFIVDGTGMKRFVYSIKAILRCIKEISELPLWQGSYGDAAVAYGTGTSFGWSTQVVIAQRRNERPKVIVSVDQSTFEVNYSRWPGG